MLEGQFHPLGSAVFGVYSGEYLRGLELTNSAAARPITLNIVRPFDVIIDTSGRFSSVNDNARRMHIVTGILANRCWLKCSSEIGPPNPTGYHHVIN